jgi:hypothetical protein
MKRIKKTLQRAWDALDDNKQMEKWLAEREAEREATKQAAFQEYVESRRILAPFAGRLVLITQFLGRRTRADRLAELINGIPSIPASLIGVSVHVSKERAEVSHPGIPEIDGVNPFINSAGALDTSFRELGYAVYRRDKIEFTEEHLGLETIADATHETANHFNVAVPEVGQIAVVSALGLSEVDLKYSPFGAAYLLDDVSQEGKFSWTAISEGDKS